MANTQGGALLTAGDGGHGAIDAENAGLSDVSCLMS